MDNKILLKDLKRGNQYTEYVPGEDDEPSSVIILANIPDHIIWIYLIGYYTMTDKAKEKFLSLEHTEGAITEYLDSIDDDDYQLAMGDFFAKYGFYHEGLIPYNTEEITRWWDNLTTNERQLILHHMCNMVYQLKPSDIDTETQRRVIIVTWYRHRNNLK